MSTNKVGSKVKGVKVFFNNQSYNVKKLEDLPKFLNLPLSKFHFQKIEENDDQLAKFGNKI